MPRVRIYIHNNIVGCAGNAAAFEGQDRLSYGDFGLFACAAVGCLAVGRRAEIGCGMAKQAVDTKNGLSFCVADGLAVTGQCHRCSDGRNRPFSATVTGDAGSVQKPQVCVSTDTADDGNAADARRHYALGTDGA